MALFSFLRKKPLFDEEAQQAITDAIRRAEQRTSGEVRVFVEARCRYVEPLDRAAEIFYGSKMHETRQRNAVLVYIALKDHQLAIFADEGIHQKTGPQFWQEEVEHMLVDFNREDYAAGLVKVIGEIGYALEVHFPYDGSTDKNELPDHILFGR